MLTPPRISRVITNFWSVAWRSPAICRMRSAFECASARVCLVDTPCTGIYVGTAASSLRTTKPALVHYAEFREEMLTASVKAHTQLPN